MSDKTDVSFTGTTLHVAEADSTTTSSGDILAGRVGVKYAMTNSGYLSLVGGIGAGVSAGGTFVAGDGGVVVLFENRCLVPFASARLFGSEPIEAKEVNLGSDEDGTQTDRPRTTRGTSIHNCAIALTPG